MAKKYKVQTRIKTATIRRRNKGKDVDGLLGFTSSPGSFGGGHGSEESYPSAEHSHRNLEALDKIRIDAERYIYIKDKDSETGESTIEKAKVGWADDSGKLEGHSLKDIINSFAKNFDKRYLRKDIDDTVNGLLTFIKGLESKGYRSGFDAEAKGWKLDADTGYAEFMSAGFRDLAMFVKGLSSNNFTAGFFGGKGWGLLPYEYENEAGVKETRYKLEIDSLSVRKTLTAHEMVINQLRGMGDNFVFAGQMKVKRAEGNMIYLDTADGTLYNPFIEGDILEVQQFGGMPTADNDYNVIKNYELRVSRAGIGNLQDGKDREDWIEFTNFVGDKKHIKEGDTLTRMDSVSNSDRKGLITVTTIDEFGAPYIDIVYGMKTEDNPIKSRFGRLEGLVTPYWGRLKGYGLMSDNAYLKGEFRLATGEDVATKFDITEGLIRSEIDAVKRAVSEKDNIIANPLFSKNYEKWSTAQDVDLFIAESKLIWANGGFCGWAKSITALTREGNMLIKRAGVKQMNKDLNNKPSTPKEGEKIPKYYLNFEYKCLQPGKLRAGFTGTKFYKEIDCVDGDWTSFSHEAEWSGDGDFVIESTGAVLIRFLSVTTNPLENYKEEMRTWRIQTAELLGQYAEKIQKNADGVTKMASKIEQTAEAITHLVSKDAFDALGNRVSNAETKIFQTAEAIEQRATKDEFNRLDIRVSSAESSIRQTANAIALKVSKTDFDDLGRRVSTAESGILQQAFAIQMTVKKEEFNGKTIMSEINIDPSSVKIKASKIDLEGMITTRMLASDVNAQLGKLKDLGDLAYKDKIEKAMLGSSIIAGGYIKAELINVDTLMARFAEFSPGNGFLKISKKQVEDDWATWTRNGMPAYVDSTYLDITGDNSKRYVNLAAMYGFANQWGQLGINGSVISNRGAGLQQNFMAAKGMFRPSFIELSQEYSEGGFIDMGIAKLGNEWFARGYIRTKWMPYVSQLSYFDEINEDNGHKALYYDTKTGVIFFK